MRVSAASTILVVLLFSQNSFYGYETRFFDQNEKKNHKEKYKGYATDSKNRPILVLVNKKTYISRSECAPKYFTQDTVVNKSLRYLRAVMKKKGQ